MNICIAGKNNIAIEAVDYLLNQNLAKVDRFVAAPNRTDNGIDSFQKSFRKFCSDRNLKLIDLEELYEIEDLILISLEYDRIIPVRKFSSSRLYNIHFSLLPKYKGMFTSALPILHGETHSGVTLHEIDRGIDTGDIIAQTKFEIGVNSTARDLYFKYIDFGISLFKENIKSILSGVFIKQAQSPINSTYFSKESIDYTNLKVDLKKTAFEIKNQIRAFNFKEYQIPKVFNSKIVSTKILNDKSTLKAGNIINETEDYIDIATIDYNLRLNKFTKIT
jgi:methionyl-tRNA formyltransferase